MLARTCVSSARREPQAYLADVLPRVSCWVVTEFVREGAGLKRTSRGDWRFGLLMPYKRDRTATGDTRSLASLTLANGVPV